MLDWKLNVGCSCSEFSDFSLCPFPFSFGGMRRWLLASAAGLLLLLVLVVLLISWWPAPAPTVYQGRTVTEWSALIFSGEPQLDQATAALRALGAKAVPDLVRQLRARDPLLHKQVEALVRRLPLPARRKVWPYLIRPDATWDRRAAARALGIIGAPARDAVPALVRALHHPDEGFAWEAAMALTHFGHDALPGLLQGMKDRRPAVRQSTAYALGELRPPAAEAVPALLTALHETDPGIRSTAANSLAKIGLPSVAPLLDVVMHETGPVRNDAGAVVLRFYNSWQRLAERATEAAQDTTAAARQRAVETLGEVGQADGLVLQLWTAALRDPASDVRLAALMHWEARAPQGEPLLVGLALCLNDPSPLVRAAAVRCLGNMGTEAQRGVPALKKMLHDPEAMVRTAAGDALQKLSPP